MSSELEWKVANALERHELEEPYHQVLVFTDMFTQHN